MDEIIVRNYLEDDKSFILASWLNSIYRSSYFARCIRKDTYFDNHHDLITNLWAHYKIIVAALKEDENIIMGYLAHEENHPNPLIHFCYVKKPFRQIGVMNKLLDHSGIDLKYKAEFTQYTYDVNWLREKYPNLEHNPYLFFKEQNAIR